MEDNIYESPELLAQYLAFHYGETETRMPWSDGPEPADPFPVRTVQELVVSDALAEDARALDLGCAVGRSAFELSRFCGEVQASDLSRGFIEAAKRLGQGEKIAYELPIEGHRKELHVANLPPEARAERVGFQTADAGDLPNNLGQFDVVHAANLLCRLPRPTALLERLPDLVKPGGQLAITTPGTWLAEFTEPEHWPPGSTLDWLKEELGESFTFQKQVDLPMMIRETGRKFQWTMAQGSAWIRK